jgi:DNA-binding transcriptional MerR regulator
VPEQEPVEPEPCLSIGQVAERTGLSVHALRYYEREGLLVDPVQRASGGRRIYSDWDVEWLELCLRFRASGMPVTTIRRYAELVRQGEGNEKERLALLRAHQEHVNSQIADLTACLDLITFKVRMYEESLAARGADPIWDLPPRHMWSGEIEDQPPAANR